MTEDSDLVTEIKALEGKLAQAKARSPVVSSDRNRSLTWRFRPCFAVVTLCLSACRGWAKPVLSKHSARLWGLMATESSLLPI